MDRALGEWEFERLVKLAAGRLPASSLDFILAGAGTESSLSRDVQAWEDFRLVPRTLAGVAAVQTKVHVMGMWLDTPILVAPTGGHGLVHGEAECETARGAAAAKCAMVLSAYSNASIEEVAATGAHLWLQLPHEQPRAHLLELVQRAWGAGYRAIVLTVDQIVTGYSPRGSRRAEELQGGLRLRNLPGAPPFVTAYHPRRRQLAPVKQSDADVAWLVEHSSLPVVVKGVLSPEDALRAAEAGAAAVVVSNHGARHLNGSLSPAHALGGVVEKVGSQVDVLVDGGIRHGEDVLRALALGAKAVMIGRAPLLALAINGASAVQGLLEHLADELRRAMLLCGAANVDDLTGAMIRQFTPGH